MGKFLNSKVGRVTAAAITVAAVSSASLAQAPTIPALDPYLDLDSVGTAISGGLVSMFTVVIPFVMVTALIWGIVRRGSGVLGGRRGV